MNFYIFFMQIPSKCGSKKICFNFQSDDAADIYSCTLACNTSGKTIYIVIPELIGILQYVLLLFIECLGGGSARLVHLTSTVCTARYFSLKQIYGPPYCAIFPAGSDTKTFSIILRNRK
jgi:hypothetical protein